MRKSLLTAATAASLALGNLAGAAAAQAVDSTVSTVTATRVYEGGSAEADFIREWITSASPAHAPAEVPAKVTVTSTTVTKGLVGQTAATPDLPAPLPASAMPGQTITIHSTAGNGSVESWTYAGAETRGESGNWELTRYRFSKPAASSP